MKNDTEQNTRGTGRFPAGPHTPSPYTTRVSDDRTDAMRPPVFTVESPFGLIAATLGGADPDGPVYWHPAFPGYPEAEYADELPADDPRYVRQFARVHAPFTVNGKAYGLSGRFERMRTGVLHLTAFAGIGSDLTPAARRKLTGWAEAHWAELHPVDAMLGAELAAANRRAADAQRALVDAAKAHDAAGAAAHTARAALRAALTAWGAR